MLLPRDVKALLRLLTHLTQRDLADFSPQNGAAGGVDVAKVSGYLLWY